MIINTNKRWAAIRKSTGKYVRSFKTRDAARSYKAANNYRYAILDQARGMIVR